MDIKSSQHYETLKHWVDINLNSEEVVSKLNQLGLDENTKTIHIKEFKRLKHEKRLYQGVVFIIIGAVMGFASCVLTITNPFPTLYNVILFGLTSAAIIVAFIGLYFIFE